MCVYPIVLLKICDIMKGKTNSFTNPHLLKAHFQATGKGAAAPLEEGICLARRNSDILEFERIHRLLRGWLSEWIREFCDTFSHVPQTPVDAAMHCVKFVFPVFTSSSRVDAG